MAKSIWTKSEQTDKKYKIEQAITAAKAKANGASICLDSIKDRNLNELITLEKLNQIVDDIILDTAYYEQ